MPIARRNQFCLTPTQNQVQETQICGDKDNQHVPNSEHQQWNNDLLSQLCQPQRSDNKLKRKVQESSNLKSKKQIDQEYRLRVKNKKIETERELEILREENARLNREIECLQTQDATKNQILQSKDEEIKQLKKENGQLKQNYEGRDIIVKALAKQLANSRDANLQYENTKLKGTITQLKNQINNQDKAADIIHRAEKIPELEEKIKALEIVVTALSEKDEE